MEQWADELAARVAAAVGGRSDPAEWLRAGAGAFFEFVGEHRAAWGALLSGDDAPVTSAFATARARQARLVAELFGRAAEQGGEALDPLVADALAHAVNGAFEALARWWPAHPAVTPAELAELVVDLIGPGLTSQRGTT